MENMTDAAIADLLFRVMTGRSGSFSLSTAMEGRRLVRWLESNRLSDSMVAPVKALMADPACFCWAGGVYDALHSILNAGEGAPPIPVSAHMAAALLAMSYDQDFQRDAAKSAGYGSYTIPDRAFWEGDPDEIPDGE